MDNDSSKHELTPMVFIIHIVRIMISWNLFCRSMIWFWEQIQKKFLSDVE
jgi:hypothetical protein